MRLSVCADDDINLANNSGDNGAQSGKAGIGTGNPTRCRGNHNSWYPAIEEADDGLREGAWVAEATSLVDMSSWPVGTRLILR
ncbi:MAG: hypothetical protein ACSLE6_18550 [Mycobacterium sp.]